MIIQNIIIIIIITPVIIIITENKPQRFLNWRKNMDMKIMVTIMMKMKFITLNQDLLLYLTLHGWQASVLSELSLLLD